MGMITVAELRPYLPQSGSVADVDLEPFVKDASALLESAIGFSFNGYSVVSQKTLYGNGSDILYIPPHKRGTINTATGVRLDTVTGTPITGWVEDDNGNLRFIGYPRYPVFWVGAQPYVITAEWGYGNPPDDLKQVCKEIAKNLYFEKDAPAVSDIVGVSGEGAVAVGYKGAFTRRQQMVINKYRDLSRPRAATIQVVPAGWPR